MGVWYEGGGEMKEPIKSMIERNVGDMNLIAKLMRKSDKLHSHEGASRLQFVLVDELMRLSRQNKDLKELIKYGNGVKEEGK